MAARKRANAKLSFYTHFVAFASVCVMLLVVTRSIRVAMIVAMSWGIGIAIHYFVVMVAPGLRRRIIRDEVGSQVRQGITQQRRAIENRNARSLEDLSASIAHEIRSPITAAKSLVQQMGEDPVSIENIEYAKVALDELDRVERSISHLLRYARDTEMRSELFFMSDVIGSSLETVRDRVAQLGVTLHCETDSPGALKGDPEKIRRVILNLVGNALDALEAADVEEPALEVLCGENLAGSEVWVRIRDNGPGIDPARMSRVFSPFYTTKKEGTGLGLALSRKVVEAHGGTLDFGAGVADGTELVLTMPKPTTAAEESR